MPGIVIVGTQWGDEGKGKITDFLAEKADCVVRYNGGSNTGHTVVVGGKKYEFHLIPAGVVRGKKSYIGNGLVIDPEVFFQELEKIEGTGIKPDLYVSERAHITFDFHRALDELEEKFKGGLRAGTTKRGVGPTYSDKAARFGIRVVDLLDRKSLEGKLDMLLRLKQGIMSQVYRGQANLDKREVLEKYLEFGRRISRYVCDVSIEVNRALDEGKTVIFEGAQGTLLDIDHGVYPFGTSSNAIAGGACTGVGISPTKIDEVIGVTKAYLSRVGTGPVPTELKDAVGERIRNKGGEYGTTTGRPRRCGWFDAVPVKYAIRVNGITSLAITKLDVLSGIDPIKICLRYQIGQKTVNEIPASHELYAKCRPVYEEHKGWPDLNDEWHNIAKKGYDALPAQTKAYLGRIEELVGAPIKIISIGPERQDTIVVE